MLFNGISNDAKVKMVQAIAYLSSIYVVYRYWDLKLFLIAMFCGWVLFGLAVSVSLHKYAAHRTFTPKNRVIKWVILWFGTIGSLGSTICWAAGHREHHRYSDQEKDPHRPKGNLWHKIKVWFFYFPTWKINPLIIKDLTSDPDHQFFHRHYYKIIAAYIAVLWFIDPRYVGYFYGIPVWYTLTGIAWATVIAHIPQLGRWSWRTYNTTDYTVNSHLWSILFIGEGLHNNHHGCPGLWDNAINKGEFDLIAPVIKLIGIPNTPVVRKHGPIRTGKALVEELASVTQRLEGKVEQNEF